MVRKDFLGDVSLEENLALGRRIVLKEIEGLRNEVKHLEYRRLRSG